MSFGGEGASPRRGRRLERRRRDGGRRASVDGGGRRRGERAAARRVWHIVVLIHQRNDGPTSSLRGFRRGASAAAASRPRPRALLAVGPAPAAPRPAVPGASHEAQLGFLTGFAAFAPASSSISRLLRARVARRRVARARRSTPKRHRVARRGGRSPRGRLRALRLRFAPARAGAGGAGRRVDGVAMASSGRRGRRRGRAEATATIGASAAGAVEGERASSWRPGSFPSSDVAGPGLPYGGVEGFVGWAAASIWGGRRRVLSCFVCFWCRGAQCSIYWASPGRRCLRRWALARAPAGAGRGSDAVVLRVHELSEEHSLVIFGSIT